MEESPRIEIYPDRGRAARHCSYGLVFIALGIWTAFDGPRDFAILPGSLVYFVVVYLGIPFFGLISASNLWVAIGRRLILLSLIHI